MIKIQGKIFTFIVLFFVFPLFSCAADGSGTNTVSPTSVNAGSTGNTLIFTFAAAETMNSGGITIAVPSNWSAPQGTSGIAGYTTISSSGIIATVEDNMDSATGWSSGTACTSGLSADAVVKQEGTASLKCANATESNGDVYYKNITAENWTNYTKIAFWIRTSAAVAAGRIFFAYDNSANLASPLQSFDLGALSANTWTYVVLTPTVARTSVVSYGFDLEHTAELVNLIIYTDDILLGPGSLTFPGGGMISARFLSLATSTTATITYGSGGGSSGATAPSTRETSTFTTQSRSSDSGTLTNIASSPTITVISGAPTGGTEAPSIPSVTSFAGGTGQSRAIFRGQTYPNSTIAVLRRLVTLPEYEGASIANSVIRDDGTFEITLKYFQQADWLFTLQAKDREGKNSRLVAFSQFVQGGSVFKVENILISPTIGVKEAVIAKGKSLSVFGYAAPNAAVEAFIDGKKIGEAKSDAAGRYSIFVSADSWEIGDYFVKTRYVLSDGRTSDFSDSKAFKVSPLEFPKSDLNNNGKVDISDWSVFLFRWGTKDAALKTTIDLNSDDKIDIADFSVFLQSFRLQ